MFVNKTLLEKCGLDVPANDWTWEDFYTICAQVTQDTDGDGSIDQFGSYGYDWQNALVSNGASLFSEDGQRCLVAQPEAVEAIAFCQKLEKLYEDCDITSRDFDEGAVAFRPFLFSDYRTYQPYPWRVKRYSGFEWDCIQMPAGPSGSALRRVTESDQTKEILGQDTPGEVHLGLELLSDTMEQAIAAPRFPQYDQALLLAENLIPTAMQDEHNLEFQLLSAQREIEAALAQ
jgi:multiple sugar transport system substrate-binding protein